MKLNSQIRVLGLFLSLSLLGCAQTSVVLLDESFKFSPSENVRILDEPPKEPYLVLARLETRGTAGQAIPSLLNLMRNEAKKIGADAIIPVDERQERQRQQIMYNQWLGGYQTIGGNSVPIVTSYAIILERSIPNRLSKNRNQPNINGGASFNTLALLLEGYGFSFWLGQNKYRGVVEYYSVRIPVAMTRDGFNDGEVESATRLSLDYFFLGDLTGPYFGMGFQFANYSASHENTNAIGKWSSIDYSISLGYKLNAFSNVYIDSRIAIDAMIYGEKEVLIGNNLMVPDNFKFYALVGVGVSF